MTRGRALLALGALALVLPGCSSSSTGGTPQRGPLAVTPACTPEAMCNACATCFDACLCGGGTSARCSESCGGKLGETGGDAATTPPDLGTLNGTLVVDAFDIPPGEEYFRCQDFENPFGRDVAVLATDSFMTAGSHHMFVFENPTSQPAPLHACSGLEFSSYIHLTQRSQERFTYPPGVGRFLSGSHGLQIQVHYLNPTNDTVHAEVAVTVHADAPSAVPIHASQIFINTLSISIPPHGPGKVLEQCGVPHDVSIIGGASHMHQHGTHFVARADDGQLLYETNQWAEPNPWIFDPPRKLAAGSTIHVECDYQNDTPYSLGFGESAATNEMCIFAGSYYPAADGEAITCLF
jgi:hypothetical protein